MAIKKKRKFNPEKALEAILFIAKNAPNPSTYWVLKIIYFADKMHLEKYGRQISGDDYFALQKGPVPSQSYDMIQDIRDERNGWYSPLAENAFEVNKATDKITALREAKLDLFSKSDIDCLTQSIAENGSLSFQDLMDKSHDTAYKEADQNDLIPLSKIIAMLPNAEALRDYLGCD